MFRYIYYTFYKFVRTTPSRDQEPEYIAAMTFALVLAFNFSFIKDSLLYYGIDISLDVEKYKWYYIGIYIILYAICHFSFVWRKKYLKIVEKYDQESRKQKIIKMSLVGLYVIGSFVLLAII